MLYFVRKNDSIVYMILAWLKSGHMESDAFELLSFGTSWVSWHNFGTNGDSVMVIMSNKGFCDYDYEKGKINGKIS